MVMNSGASEKFSRVHIQKFLKHQTSPPPPPPSTSHLPDFFTYREGAEGSMWSAQCACPYYNLCLTAGLRSNWQVSNPKTRSSAVP